MATSRFHEQAPDRGMRTDRARCRPHRDDLGDRCVLVRDRPRSERALEVDAVAASARVPDYRTATRRGPARCRKPSLHPQVWPAAVSAEPIAPPFGVPESGVLPRPGDAPLDRRQAARDRLLRGLPGAPGVASRLPRRDSQAAREPWDLA